MVQMSDQKIIVTAGASGIGAAIVDKFLSGGAQVHIADIDGGAVAALAERPGLTTSMADVSNEDDVAALFKTAVANMDGLTVLVNCAGIAGPTAAVENIDLEDWRACLAVSLDGTFLCSRQAIPYLKEAGAGSIINMSSTAGLMGYPLRAPYASAKWALIGLTKTLAMELGPFGIRVNAICPGSVDGPRMDAVIAAESAQKGIKAQVIRDRYTADSSLRTFVSVEDIANMAAFLVSAQAARVSGQAIPVDGHVVNAGGLEIT
jgi:NAD(P)-dependent dehydrogenase (short-subunit alcohol dehydrogenase family)